MAKHETPSARAFGAAFNAALLAADEGTPIVAADRHVDAALRELLVEGGELTRSLLGARGAARAGDGGE